MTLEKAVLIADDSHLVRGLLKETVATAKPDACILEFSDGKQALDAMDYSHNYLVISDTQMPLMEGPELIAEARKKGYTFTPILLSAADNSRRAAEVGAVFLQKPLDTAVLEQAVIDFYSS